MPGIKNPRPTPSANPVPHAVRDGPVGKRNGASNRRPPFVIMPSPILGNEIIICIFLICIRQEMLNAQAVLPSKPGWGLR